MARWNNEAEPQIERTPKQVRQGGIGMHVFTILLISTVIAFVGLIAFAAFTGGAS